MKLSAYSGRGRGWLSVYVHLVVWSVIAPIAGGADECEFDVLAPAEPRPFMLHEGFALAIDHLDANHLNFLVRNYSPTLAGSVLKTADYVERARQFAADTLDSHSVSDVALMPSGEKRWIKMNLSTGELLLADGAGRLVLYTRLPVGKGGLGNFSNSRQLFEALVSLIPAGPNGKVMPSLTVGESIEVKGFPTNDQANKHFRKHVLNIAPGASMEQWLVNAKNVRTEFPDLLAGFFGDPRLREGNVDAAYMAHLSLYEKRAVEFAGSNDPRIITLTRRQPDPVRPERTNLVSYRFNPYTNELLVVNRDKGTIITYHKVDAHHPLAAGYLRKLGLPPTKNTFEYFLATATMNRTFESGDPQP